MSIIVDASITTHDSAKFFTSQRDKMWEYTTEPRLLQLSDTRFFIFHFTIAFSPSFYPTTLPPPGWFSGDLITRQRIISFFESKPTTSLFFWINYSWGLPLYIPSNKQVLFYGGLQSILHTTSPDITYQQQHFWGQANYYHIQ